MVGMLFTYLLCVVAFPLCPLRRHVLTRMQSFMPGTRAVWQRRSALTGSSGRADSPTHCQRFEPHTHSKQRRVDTHKASNWLTPLLAVALASCRLIATAPFTMAAAQSFTSGLDAKSLEAFSVACKRPFGEQVRTRRFVPSQPAVRIRSLFPLLSVCSLSLSRLQAQFFLNAFWDESNDQAEAIYSVAFELIKRADMRWRNITYVHMYEEGNDLDFDMGQ